MERLTYFLLGLTYTSRIKWWATLFDPLGSCCTRLFKNEMSQDDARLVKWLLWLATYTFFATWVLFQLNKSFKWKLLRLICIFELSFCTMSLTVSSCYIWENMVAQMISNLNFWSETQAEPWVVNRKGFETKKRRCGNTMAK